MDVSIVVPVWNQSHYTRQFLVSLDSAGDKPAEIIVIDNASTDDTAALLATRPDIKVISNAENLGCAVAWNQGVHAAKSEWTVVINNDILVSPGWLRELLDFANEHHLDIVSPSIREGEYNYDLTEYARGFVTSMRGLARLGIADGICFMVNRRVFDKIGYFDEQFRIGQFEDTDFFRRARLDGFKLGTTGRSLIHHFGQVTQKAVRTETASAGISASADYAKVNRTYYRKKWKLSWWRRFVERHYMNMRLYLWRSRELRTTSHSMKEKWLDGRLRYY